MAISNYTELQNAVDNWLGHALFTARVPEFIAMAEASFNRRLRVRQQEVSVEITMTNGVGSLPTDYLIHRTVNAVVDDRIIPLEYTPPTVFNVYHPLLVNGAPAGGLPAMFTILGTKIFIRPSPSSDVSIGLDYYAKVPSLASAVTGTNWLLNEHPDLYLFGSLIEAEAFGVNDNRLPLWKARRDEIYEDMERLSNRSRGAGMVRVMSATP